MFLLGIERLNIDVAGWRVGSNTPPFEWIDPIWGRHRRDSSYPAARSGGAGLLRLLTHFVSKTPPLTPKKLEKSAGDYYN